jgi:hypothetical protein
MHVDVDFSKFHSAVVTALSGIINCNVYIICFLVIFITLKCHFHSLILGFSLYSFWLFGFSFVFSEPFISHVFYIEQGIILLEKLCF